MKIEMIMGIVIAIIVLLIIWMILSYNKLQLTRTKVENSWGQVNVQLKMRSDLVPNLVSTVSGYAKHEKDTLESVMQARNGYLQAQNITNMVKANDELDHTLSKLLAVAENYPDLKANQNFLDLQNQLKEIEQKLAMYRQFYNDVVLMYNRKVITFPANIPAGIFGFRELSYFDITEKERVSPKVLF